MEKKYLLGTDIGTQGTKTIVVDLEGNVLASAIRNYEVIKPKPLWAEQWPDTWVKAVFETVKEVLEKSKVNPLEVAGIAISGLYGGSGVPVDKDMEPIRPCLIWMDRRAQKEVEWVKKNVPLDKLFEITGNYVDSYFGFTKIMWIRNNEPENWKRIYQFISPKDYVIYVMTGENAIDYSSAGNLGGVFDLRKKYWSEEMCKILNIPMSMLPERMVKSADVVGRVTKEASELCGLAEGTPVIAGGIDAPVAALSVGVLEEKSHVAMVGTSTCWGVIHRGGNITPKLVSYPYVAYDDEIIYTFGGSATTGGLATWFRNEFGQKELEFEKAIGISAYKLLEQEAEDIPAGSEGLIVLPYFMGERSPIWDPNAKGTIIGLTLYHTRKHVYRAILEGAAYALRHNMDEGMKAGLELAPECIMTGGVAKSKLWVQIFADVTGFPMRIPVEDFEAPYADALLAGVGSGVLSSYEKIKEWVKFREPVKPNPENKKIYDEYYKEYLKSYEALKEIMENLSKIAMR
jgi:xylulokinase